MTTPRRRRRFSASHSGDYVAPEADDWRVVSEPSPVPLSPEAPGPAWPPFDQKPAPSVPTRGLEPLRPVQPHLRNKRFSASRLVLQSTICITLGLLGGYLLARLPRTAPISAASGGYQKEVNPLTPDEENDLDTAYTASQTHEFASAEQLFKAFRQNHPQWTATELEVGRTLLYEGRLVEAQATLKSAIDKGLMPAEANFLLGALFSSQKNYPEAESRFAKAVALDSTRPEYYFFWGECLRKEGKPLAAIGKFRSALLRNQYETATGLYRAKLWLSEIEADQEDSSGTNARIDAALAQWHPPMEACIAAAARALKAGDPGAATVQLLRARRHSDPTVFLYLLNDPVFDQIRMRPEWATQSQTASPVSDSPAEGK